MIAALARAESNCIAFLKRELAPSQARWQSVIRLTITSSVILATMNIFRLGEGYWAVITMLLVCGPNVPSSFRKGLERIVGTTLGVSVAYATYATLFQQPWFLIPAIFACIMVGALVIVRCDAPYVGWVFVLSVLIVVSDSHRAFDTIANVAFAREWVVGIGIGLSWIAMRTIFPVHALAALQSRLRALTAQTRARIAFVRGQLDSNTDAPSDVTALPPAIDSAQIQELLLLIRNLLDERPTFRASIDQLTDRVLILESISVISSSAIGALRALNEQGRASPFTAHVIAVTESLDTVLVALQEWIEQLDWKADGFSRVAIDFSAVDTALVRLAAFHDSEISRLGINPGVAPATHSDPPLPLQSLLPLIGFTALVRAMRASVTNVTLDTAPERQDGSRIRKSITRALFGLGLRGDAPRGMSFAIRTAIACTIGWIFVTATGYVSLSTMLVTPLMVVGPTGGSVEAIRIRARLRFLGGLAGGAVGILALVFVVPTIESLAALTCLWVLCAAPFLWIFAGSPRISYFGFQGMFCLSIILIGPLAPSVNMTPLGGRVTGILLGVIVTYIVFGIVAPDYGRNELFDVGASAFRRIGAIVRSGFPDRPTTYSQLSDMRYRTYALVLRMRTLAASLDATPDADSPGLTSSQVGRVEVHLARLLATANAIAMNRLTGTLSPTLLLDVSELLACADAIEQCCQGIAAAMDERHFGNMGSMLATVDARMSELDARLPEIRLRPSVRILGAVDAERVLGQISLYHVASKQLHDLVAELTDIRTQNERFRASQRQCLPIHSAQSSTA